MLRQSGSVWKLHAGQNDNGRLHEGPPTKAERVHDARETTSSGTSETAETPSGLADRDRSR